MVQRDIVVVGASSGGLEALKTLVSGLPVDLNATVFIVRHLSPDGPRLLPDLLQACTPLPVSHPVDGEPFQRGHIYIAPPDRHLVVERTQMRVTRGPKENFCRPAVDPLFRSAAYAHR